MLYYKITRGLSQVYLNEIFIGSLRLATHSTTQSDSLNISASSVLGLALNINNFYWLALVQSKIGFFNVSASIEWFCLLYSIRKIGIHLDISRVKKTTEVTTIYQK
jgi:hypothetical protein